ncbi:MAG: hypothetical protein C0417_05300 [Chlorobiaceae bacterium]|nr:hypothetical protein [Chlorobiaceae bacterium]
MIRHKKIQIQLYDYLQNALSGDDKIIVEDHLRSCEICKRTVVGLKDVIEKFQCLTNPAEERSTEYWNNFALTVERRILNPQNKSISPNLIDQLYSLFVLNKKTTIALSTAMVLMLVIGLWYMNKEQLLKVPQQQASVQNQDTALVEKRIGNYFRRSKTLLVGLANLELEHGRSPDLNTEQSVSRELIDESRDLRQQPIDIRSAELMRDMENVLVTFSKIPPQTTQIEFDNIRRRIYRDNLLFKIRMAESAYDEESQSRQPIQNNRMP